MGLRLYEYAGCSTCRKARNWLTAQGLTFERIDLVATPPSREVLEDLHKRSGLEMKKMFNTSGQSYRNGGFKDRLPTMTDEEKFEALAADGKLVKRPILDTGDLVKIAFREAEWAKALGVDA